MNQRNILLAVSGLSPAVITETLYALYMEGKRVDELHIITTKIGKEHLLAKLLSPVDGKIVEFMREYGLAAGSIRYGPETVYVPKDKDGRELSDILTEEDNELLLHLCLGLTFQFTRDPAASVFFLVAGGRKTMTSCLTLAAQCYGRRPQDKILHVLVSPSDIEGPDADFWYPRPGEGAVSWYDQRQRITKTIEHKKIEINLIYLPFVPLREMLPEGKDLELQEPADLLSRLIKEPSPGLRLKVPEKRVLWGQTIELDGLSPVEFAVYAYFAWLRQTCPVCRNTGEVCDKCSLSYDGINTLEAAKCQNVIYDRIPIKPFREPNRWGVQDSFFVGEDGDGKLFDNNFRPNRTRINAKIRKYLGISFFRDLELAQVDAGRCHGRYGIRLAPERIVIDWGEEGAPGAPFW